MGNKSKQKSTEAKFSPKSESLLSLAEYRKFL